MREALGDHIFDKFIENKKIEWDAYRTHVSQFEIDRYLPYPVIVGPVPLPSVPARERMVSTSPARKGRGRFISIREISGGAGFPPDSGQSNHEKSGLPVQRPESFIKALAHDIIRI